LSLNPVLSTLAGLVPTPRSNGARCVQVGLIGRGIGASLTPVMHVREGERLNLDYSYSLIDFDVLEFEDSDLEAIVLGVQQLGFAGLNVTFPFKQAVIGLLDGLSPQAEAIGAVNTIVFESYGAIGHNTDCWGFAESFRRDMGGVARDSVLQLGAGGAGAAVAQALLELGVGALAIHDLDGGKAQALAGNLNRKFAGRVTVVNAIDGGVDVFDGVVNTTPVGMTKLPGMPMDPELLSPEQWVADIVYFPRETELLVKARARGCRVMPGTGMAIFQAVKAFELLSGRVPDAAQMARTFELER
jgi:shikimate dehydrogenase